MGPPLRSAHGASSISVNPLMMSSVETACRSPNTRFGSGDKNATRGVDSHASIKWACAIHSVCADRGVRRRIGDEIREETETFNVGRRHQWTDRLQ